MISMTFVVWGHLIDPVWAWRSWASDTMCKICRKFCLKSGKSLLIFVVNNKKRSVCLFGVIFWRNTSPTRSAYCYNFEVLTKSTSPQLLRSQDFDQLSRLRRSGNDQHYKSLLAQLRCYQNDRLDWSIAFLVKGDRMQIPFKLAAYL